MASDRGCRRCGCRRRHRSSRCASVFALVVPVHSVASCRACSESWMRRHPARRRSTAGGALAAGMIWEGGAKRRAGRTGGVQRVAPKLVTGRRHSGGGGSGGGGGGEVEDAERHSLLHDCCERSRRTPQSRCKSRHTGHTGSLPAHANLAFHKLARVRRRNGSRGIVGVASCVPTSFSVLMSVALACAAAPRGWTRPHCSLRQSLRPWLPENH